MEKRRPRLGAAENPMGRPGPDSPGFLLNQASLAVNRTLDRALADSGITVTGAQWAIISLLESEQADTASDLAKHLGTDVAATWRIVERLVAKGFIEKIEDPEDARVKLLALTTEARKRFADWEAIVARTTQSIMTGLSTKDVAVLIKALQTITDNARNVD
ncbi:MarR family winged helix-turn-helix transcriptional regulator [Lentzea sp. NPDC060358]|uniref:MarR family winged helix-turn-helix transcriptional regulator n=1 Tax=Lentzea sp. NPDC060358 TaxID=3347103 RepID=UPI003657A545